MRVDDREEVIGSHISGVHIEKKEKFIGVDDPKAVKIKDPGVGEVFIWRDQSQGKGKACNQWWWALGKGKACF